MKIFKKVFFDDTYGEPPIFRPLGETGHPIEWDY